MTAKIFILCIVLLTACQPQTEERQVERHETVSIVTADGRVALPANPKSIAVYDYAVFDTVSALGVRPAVVPEKNLLPYLEDDFRQAALRAGSIFEPDLEALYAARPDVILLGTATTRHQNELAAIAPTVNMRINGGTLISDGLKRLTELGRLFGKEEVALQWRSRIETLLADTRRVITASPPENGAVLMVQGGKLVMFGQQSYFGWLYRELGIKPVAELQTSGDAGLPVGFEFLRQSDPDWLFVIDRDSAVGESGQSAAAMLDNALVHQTRAWRQGHIVYLSGAAFTAGGGVRQMEQDLQTIKKAFEKRSGQSAGQINK